MKPLPRPSPKTAALALRARGIGCRPIWYDGIYGWAFHCGCSDLKHACDQQCSMITEESISREEGAAMTSKAITGEAEIFLCDNCGSTGQVAGSYVADGYKKPHPVYADCMSSVCCARRQKGGCTFSDDCSCRTCVALRAIKELDKPTGALKNPGGGWG